MRRQAFVLLFALGGTAARLPAQASPPLRLSFAEVVRRAAGTAPAVELAALRTKEADARVRQARAALLPALAISGAWVNRDFNTEALGIPFPPQFGLPNPAPSFNNYDARLTATQTLSEGSTAAPGGPDPGRRPGRRDASR